MYDVRIVGEGDATFLQTNSIYFVDRKGGVKKSQNSVDVINGSPLRHFFVYLDRMSRLFY